MKKLKPRVYIATVLVVFLFFVFSTLIIILINRNSVKEEDKLAKFSSCQDIADWINLQRQGQYPPGYPMPALDASRSDGEGTASNSTGGFSTTNVQVAGVDEADTVKVNDSRIFTIRDGRVVVFTKNAAGHWSKPVRIFTDFIPTELYLTEGKLVVFGSQSSLRPTATEDIAVPEAADARLIYPVNQHTYVRVFNVNSLKPERTLVYEGNWQTSRRIGSEIYLVSNQYNLWYGLQVSAEQIEKNLPKFNSYEENEFADMDIAPNKALADCNSISYFGEPATSYVSLMKFNIENGEVNSHLIMGNAETVYASTDNLYLAATKYDYGDVQPCSWWDSMWGGCLYSSRYFENPEVTTNIYRFALEDLQFKAQGNVKGQLLNQFALDQHSSFLRVATTVTTGSTTTNSVYVLNDQLSLVGSLESLAFTERIYSTRFIGERLYMVTFRTIDPLFVIDLSQPSAPLVMGELKIPGFSNYLHPYDENTIIGFGREADTVTGRTGRLKLALFNVSNPKEPKQLATYTFAATVTDSSILYNHKDLYFERERNLMAIPVDLQGVAANLKELAVFDVSSTAITLKEQISDKGFGERVAGYKSFGDSYRGIRIDNQFLAVGLNQLDVFDLSNWKAMQQVSWELSDLE